MNTIGKLNILPLYRAGKDQRRTLNGSKIIFISLGVHASLILIPHKTATLYCE